jgi:hypothetical protein
MLLKELFTNSYTWAIPKRLVYKKPKEAITFGKEKRTLLFMIENLKSSLENKQMSFT